MHHDEPRINKTLQFMTLSMEVIQLMYAYKICLIVCKCTLALVHYCPSKYKLVAPLLPSIQACCHLEHNKRISMITSNSSHLTLGRSVSSHSTLPSSFEKLLHWNITIWKQGNDSFSILFCTIPREWSKAE